MSKFNITMRDQLAACAANSQSIPASHRDASNETQPEPSLRDKLAATAAGIDVDAVDTLIGLDRARIGDSGGVEVMTLHGWYPAVDWSIRQAVDIAPARAAPSEATLETIAERLVDRRRRKSDE